MSRIWIKHEGRRYLLRFDDGKVVVKRRGWLLNWNARTAEREAIARLLAKGLSELWPHAIKHEVLIGLEAGK
jgi:hypothetical protein